MYKWTAGLARIARPTPERRPERLALDQPEIREVLPIFSPNNLLLTIVGTK